LRLRDVNNHTHKCPSGHPGIGDPTEPLTHLVLMLQVLQQHGLRDVVRIWVLTQHEGKDLLLLAGIKG
jgi:hypothetical protein